MKNLNKWIQAISKNAILILTLGLFTTLVLLVNSIFKPRFTYLTQTFHYTSEYAYTFLSSIGPEGRNIHLLVLLADFFLIILYTLFLLGANYRCFYSWVKNCTLLSLLTFFPLLLTIDQLLEIIGLAVLILHYPTPFLGLAHTLSTLTTLKYYLTPLCFLLPLIGLGVKMILNIKANKVKNNEKNYH